MSVLDFLNLSSLPIPNRLLSRIQTGMMTYPPGTSLGLDCTWKVDPYSCIYKLPCSIASGWFWPVGSQGNHWRDSESQGGVRASLRPSHCPSGCAPPHRPAVPARRLSPSYRFWESSTPPPILLPLLSYTDHHFLLLPVLGWFTAPLWFPITLPTTWSTIH